MSAASHSFLRLVRADESAHGLWADGERARLEVIKENRLAAHAPGLDPSGPHWALALQAHGQLEGAVLRPDRRARLIASGARLGLRPFESNLVIAIVQDRARCTADVRTAAPTLRLLQEAHRASRPTAESRRPRLGVLASAIRWLLAFVAAGAVALLLARWLGAG